MQTPKEFQNCKHWQFKPCPEGNTMAMMRTHITDSIQIPLTGYEIEQANKLCQKCNKFEPNQ